jgi:hypothetical protein
LFFPPQEDDHRLLELDLASTCARPSTRPDIGKGGCRVKNIEDAKAERNSRQVVFGHLTLSPPIARRLFRTWPPRAVLVAGLARGIGAIAS